MNYRTFFDSNSKYNLSDVYKVLTKKYFAGRDNRTVHHTVLEHMEFYKKEIVSFGSCTTRNPRRDGVRWIVLYQKVYDDGYHYSLNISNKLMTINKFDIIDQKYDYELVSVMNLPDILQGEQLTEERFFQISTITELYGLTHQELLTLQKIWNILQD